MSKNEWQPRRKFSTGEVLGWVIVVTGVVLLVAMSIGLVLRINSAL